MELYKKNIIRSRHIPDDSSDEDEEPEAAKPRIIEKEEHIGKIVCVESTETKKKGPKENWFPALVVAPTAQDTVRICIKDEYLVRSFKDSRYYTVPKTEATEFTRELALKQDTAAVTAALEYLHNDCLPAHWDREALFGLGNSSSDFYNEFDSDSSDDEPTEEKDHFVAQLYKYMDDRGTPLNKGPSIVNKDVDLYRLYRAVQKLSGYNRVTSQNQWKQIATRLGFVPITNSIQNLVKQAYKKFLLPFEEFDRKLGCTMVAHPRANRIKGRSLVRANSVASPKPEKESKLITSAAEESENTSESSVDIAKVPKPKAVKCRSLMERLEDLRDELKDELIIEQKEKKVAGGSSKEIEAIGQPSTSSASVKVRATAKVTKEKEKEKEQIAVQTTSKAAAPDAPPLTPSTKAIKEKPASAPAKKQTAPPNDEKRGKKRVKEIDNVKPKPEPIVDKDKGSGSDQSDFAINVGDKLKVYYHEQKVTYEAKVIEISKQNENALFLVHYTGWNTRYDEWVPKERIAENLTSKQTNKRAKNGSKAEARSNSAASDKLSGPSPMIRASVKRSRGSSRGESQPPRSTTPSSIASNSSRTKSPATPAQRRTTRGQPNTLRRTSNNTDISSLQTDSDTDSDEPVVKKPTPKRKTSAAKAQSQRSSASDTIENNKTNSNPSSEEESLASVKGREYNLSQLRAEMKGFKDVKIGISSAESSAADAAAAAGTDEKKFDYEIKEESTTADTATQSSTEAAKTASDNSSETDSYGDEDSQFSDKTTTLENISEKFQKFVFNKAPVAAVKTELVDKVATLKPSGIEKIIKNSLAEKSKALPLESMSMKTLCERTPLMQFEREKEKERERESALSKHTDVENEIVATTVAKPVPIAATSAATAATSETPKIEANVKTEPSDKPTTKSVFGEKTPTKPQPVTSKTPLKEKGPSIIRQSIISMKDDHLKSTEADAKSAATSAPSSSSFSPASSAPPCDIYEFKEPEPFEFEASSSKKPSPEIEKKGKRKTVLERIESQPPKVLNPLAAKRAKKSMKDIEKLKDIKLDDDDEMPKTSPTTSPAANILPAKVESIFDSLRKSPSFNLNMATANMQDEIAAGGLIETLTLAPVAIEPSTSTSVEVRPSFISSFVETTPAPIIKAIEETAKIFDLKSNADSKELDKELESVKKMMLNDDVLNLEPPKIDKPSSIADKVLKDLQNASHIAKTQHSQPPVAEKDNKEPAVDSKKNILVESTIALPPELKPLTVTCASPFEGAANETTLTPAAINQDVETPPTKPVLSSPEHKIDILESIAPKNNDLSETIQKLESAIQKSAELNHISDDSTDSTDSEQRLVIEDESQSSETQNEFTGLVSNKTAEVDEKKVVDTVPIVEKKSHVLAVELPHAQLLELATAAAAEPPVSEAKIEIKLSETSTIKRDDTFVNMAAVDSQSESISLLLCEETIPGSPAPSYPKEPCDTKKSYDCIFASPNSTGAETKSMDIETTAPVATGSTAHTSKNKNQSGTPGSSPRDSMSQDDSSEENNKKQGNSTISLAMLGIFELNQVFHFALSEQDRAVSPKKRRGARKQSESDHTTKRRKASGRRNTITGMQRLKSKQPISSMLTVDFAFTSFATGSDSEDNSDVNATQRSLQRPSKSCQYNFLVQLGKFKIDLSSCRSPNHPSFTLRSHSDPAMNSTQRISLLKKKIQDLRKTYNMIKTELASIDRRRKKLRRREREIKKNVQKQLQQQQHHHHQQQHQIILQASTTQIISTVQVNITHQSSTSNT